MLAERALLDSLAYYGDTLVVISYHVGQTYENSNALEREFFYDTGEPLPYVIFDGTVVIREQNYTSYVTRYQQAIAAARSVTPLYNVYVLNANADENSGSVSLRIVTADTIPDDEIFAYVFILEDSLQGAYTTFYRVCRLSYHLPVTLVYPDSLDTTINFAHDIPVDKMKAVLCVQDMDTKEVLQTTMSPFEE